jgi:hypothetical protein
VDATISKTGKGCYKVDMVADSPDWEQWFLLRSDAHHDNAHSSHRQEMSHLIEAQERNAGILDAGDLFCAMQGKWDRRSDTSQCRPEHQQGRYLDSLVETAAEFYEPFVDNWLLLAPGNHETSITKRHETDLTERLAERFRLQGSPVEIGTYSGFIRFVVRIADRTLSRVMYYHHGSGGGGPMTHGVLATRRMQSYLPDADIIWSGHTHDSWCVRLAKAKLSPYGNVHVDDVWHIKTPGYKDEFTPLEGWHIERGAPPKPTGAAWLKLSIANMSKPTNKRVMRVDVMEAR